MYIFTTRDINGKHYLTDDSNKVIHFSDKESALNFAKAQGFDMDEADELIEEVESVEGIVLYSL